MWPEGFLILSCVQVFSLQCVLAKRYFAISFCILFRQHISYLSVMILSLIFLDSILNVVILGVSKSCNFELLYFKVFILVNLYLILFAMASFKVYSIFILEPNFLSFICFFLEFKFGKERV